jgi:hypothetical protein
MAIRGQMRFEFCLADAFVPESALDGEIQLRTPYLEVCQRRAFHSETGNDNRSDPAFAAFLRQIENELQLFSRNLRRAFPAASSALRRLAKQFSRTALPIRLAAYPRGARPT